MKTERHRPSPFHLFSPVTTLLTAVLMLGTLTLSACGDPPPPPMPSEIEFSLEVFVYDQDETPVPRLPVLVDGQTVGHTDKNGSFAARILEAPNTPIELSLGETSKYRFTSDNIVRETLTVRHGVEGQPVGLPVTLRTSVHSLQNAYLAWVELKCDELLKKEACENIPLQLDGKKVATTDADGKAHFAFDGVIGNKSILTIETPTFPKDSEDYVVFDPKQPSYELNLGLDSTVFHIEETFTDLFALRAEQEAAKAAPKRRVRRPARRRATTRKTTRKAPAKKAAPKKKAKPKSGGVIDLW